MDLIIDFRKEVLIASSPRPRSSFECATTTISIKHAGLSTSPGSSRRCGRMITRSCYRCLVLSGMCGKIYLLQRFVAANAIVEAYEQMMFGSYFTTVVPFSFFLLPSLYLPITHTISRNNDMATSHFGKFFTAFPICYALMYSISLHFPPPAENTRHPSDITR